MAKHHIAYTALFGVLETLIKMVLANDPGSKQLAEQISPKVLQIIITPAEDTIFICFNKDDIALLSHYEGPISTTLAGPVSALFQLLFKPEKNLYHSAVDVSGDASLLSHIQALANNVEIDWEDALSSLIGVVPAHGVANIISQTLDYQSERLANFRRLFKEFVTEEINVSVSDNQFQSFSEEVDELQLAADRLEASMAQLKSQINATSGAQH